MHPLLHPKWWAVAIAAAGTGFAQSPEDHWSFQLLLVPEEPTVSEAVFLGPYFAAFALLFARPCSIAARLRQQRDVRGINRPDECL